LTIWRGEIGSVLETHLTRVDEWPQTPPNAQIGQPAPPEGFWPLSSLVNVETHTSSRRILARRGCRLIGGDQRLPQDLTSTVSPIWPAVGNPCRSVRIYLIDLAPLSLLVLTIQPASSPSVPASTYRTALERLQIESPPSFIHHRHHDAAFPNC
jgi:hypothetical protein